MSEVLNGVMEGGELIVLKFCKILIRERERQEKQRKLSAKSKMFGLTQIEVFYNKCIA